MNWDWKKANGAKADSRGESMGVGPRPKRSPAGGRLARGIPGSERTASITWRPGGLGAVSLAESGVALREEGEHECPFCRGRGAVAGASVCPVCNGAGTVRVDGPAVRCAFCGGHGQMPPRSHLTCWVCNGKGFAPVTLPVQVCPDCQGRGKRPCATLYCPRCRGIGVTSGPGAL
ncbi:MAG: hypothetical protein NTV86_17190 [Planctomycetota bacterium]|nr:hypothetical protein [Planctomycetota bacterium]